MAETIKWFKSAAQRSYFDNPNGYACYWLGMIYYVGAGVEKNLRMAYSYFENAYGLGCAEAVSMLYRCYSRGEGISVNGPMADELRETASRDGISVDEILARIEGYDVD